MTIPVNPDSVYIPSENVIAKSIEGQVVIVPLIAGTGNLNDELFQLNETGSEVWELLQKKKRLSAVITMLAEKYEAPREIIAGDVVSLITRLMNKKFVVELC